MLHFPSNTGNHPATLAAAERSLGHQVDVVCVEENPYYDGQGVQSLHLENTSTLRRWWKRVLYARQVVDNYDVFHFNKGETFLPGSLPFVVDLWWLRRRGKKVIVTFQGSDARPHVQGAPTTRRVPVRVANWIRRARIRQIKRWADRMWVLNPDLLEHVEGAEFLPYASVDTHDLVPTDMAEHRDVLRIVHAPTNRAVKGTAAIERAVQEAARDLPIELRIIEGTTREDVLNAIRGAHLVIDQVVLGWYGGLAVEAMALGRPVIAHISGDVDDEDFPIINADGDSLAQVLVDTAQRDLAELGAQARVWVERHHDPRAVAQRTTIDYR